MSRIPKLFLLIIFSIPFALSSLTTGIAFAETAAACSVPGTYATIQAAIDDVACTEINVAANTYQENLTIGRDVTINGAVNADNEPETFIDGQQLQSTVIIQLAAVVQLNNLVIQNGNARSLANGTGGGINIIGVPTVLLDNVIVQNNTAYVGGGIYAEDGVLSLNNSQILDNVAEQPGGGIHTEQAKLFALDFVVSRNSATYGGAIYASGQVELINGVFQENQSSGVGGALRLFRLFPSELSGLQFIDNETGFRGGAIYTDRPIEITDSTFSGNHSGEDGGAIYVEGVSLSLTDSDFANNSATRDGGAIWMTQMEEGALPDLTLTVVNGSWADNSAENDGGVIDVNGEIDVTLTGINAYRNQATGRGGVISVNYIDVPDHEATVELNIQQSTFSDNSAMFSGVADATGNVDMIVENVGAYRNQAQSSGVFGLNTGFLTRNSSTSIISNSVFQHNSATEGVGGVLSGGGNKSITMQNVYASNNHASVHGGVVYTGGIQDLSLLNSTFENNSADVNGGAIHTEGVTTLNMDGVLTKQNSAGKNGGGVHVIAANTYIQNSTIYKNTAENGGGIYIRFSAFLNIQAVSIDDNSATLAGGGVAFAGQVAGELKQASVTNNSAEIGGGIHIDAQKLGGTFPYNKVQLKQLLIGYNNAISSGGGILIAETTDTDVEIDQVAIYRNTARIGGGVLHDGSQLSIRNSAVSENSALDFGSAIFGGKPLSTHSVTIADNTGAGAIHKLNSADLFNIQNSIIFNPDVDNCTGDTSTIALANNWIGDATCYSTRSGASSGLTGDDPMIAPLADNGEGQMSHVLLAGSPARRAGVNCLEVDQHGVSRPNTNCDLGSFQTPLVPTAVTLSSAATNAVENPIMIYGLMFMLSVLSGVVIRDRKQHR